MGFMENLRRNVFGVFGTIVLFIILILFLWGDASRGGSGGGGDANIAGYVNGEEITQIELNARVDEIVNMNQQQGQNMDREVIRQQVWDQLVNEKLLYQEAARLGVGVTDEEIRMAMFTQPQEPLRGWFTDSAGMFMQDLYNDFLRDVDGFLAEREVPPDQIAMMRTQVLQMERQIRLQKSYERVSGVVGAMFPRSPVMIRTNYDLTKTTASGTFALLSTNLIADAEVNVTDEEINEYYESHKESFNRKAAKLGRYAMLRLGPSDQDTSVVQNRFRRFNQAMGAASTQEAKDSVFGVLAAEMGTQRFNGSTFISQNELPEEVKDTLTKLTAPAVIGPTRIEGKTYYLNLTQIRDSGAAEVKAQHILFKSEEENDSIKALAESVLAKARSGANFADLVTEYSEDQASVPQGGDVGWFNANSSFVPEFKEAALDAQTGDIVGPVKTQFGYHIIKISDRSTRSYKLRGLSFDVEISNNTRNKLQRKAQDLQRRLQQGEDFDALAQELELQVLETSPVTSPNTAIAGSYELPYFIWNNDIGDVSKVMIQPDESRIVAKVTEKRNAGAAPIDEVRDQITATLRNRKKIEMLKARAEKVRSSFSGDSLSAIAQLDSSIIVRPFSDVNANGSFPDVGVDVGLSSTLFDQKVGTVSQPIRGERGYYIVQLNALNKPEEASFKAEKTEYTGQLMQQERQRLFNDWLQEARDNAKIERNW